LVRADLRDLELVAHVAQHSCYSAFWIVARRFAINPRPPRVPDDIGQDLQLSKDAAVARPEGEIEHDRNIVDISVYHRLLRRQSRRLEHGAERQRATKFIRLESPRRYRRLGSQVRAHKSDILGKAPVGLSDSGHAANKLNAHNEK
jgi:hypothetical protein